jgi:DNA ligase (NAD+)
VGPVVAQHAAAYFRDPDNVVMLDRLLASGIAWPARTATRVHSGLGGQTLVLTGTLESLTREQAADLIAERGGKVSGSVSKKTSYVVAGAEAGSKLKKANALGIPVLDEAAFLKLLKT